MTLNIVSIHLFCSAQQPCARWKSIYFLTLQTRKLRPRGYSVKEGIDEVRIWTLSQSWLVTPFCCLVLNCCSKLTFLFPCSNLLPFVRVCVFLWPLSLLFFYVLKIDGKKVVWKRDTLFAVNLVIHRCFKNQHRWQPLFQHHLLCYLHKCQDKICFLWNSGSGSLLCFVMLFL